MQDHVSFIRSFLLKCTFSHHINKQSFFVIILKGELDLSNSSNILWQSLVLLGDTKLCKNRDPSPLLANLHNSSELRENNKLGVMVIEVLKSKSETVSLLQTPNIDPT